MVYLKLGDDNFEALGSEMADILRQVPEFYEKASGVPEDLWGMRRRPEILEASHPEVRAFLLAQDVRAAEFKRIEALRNDAKLAIAKSAGLTEEQIGALFG